MNITVVAPGPSATVQDLGRPGHGRWGVPPGGAADRGSLRLANRLVGNAEGAAALELTLGGASFTVSDGVFIAVTGADAPVTVGGGAANSYAPQWVPVGATVRLGMPGSGLRTYVAFRGGLETGLMLGSRSVDPPSGFGNALRAGDRLPVGRATGPFPSVGVAVGVTPQPGSVSPVELSATLGPRSSWCPPEALASFTSQEWIVGADSNRVGVRLLGEPIGRYPLPELASEPALRGAVELPPDGQPIVFMADHPTTCGYPIIAVLDAAATDACAQLRPGDRARLRLTQF